MKTLIAFLIGAASATATAADKDMYERFASTLIYADDFPNEEVHRLVADAMASEDSEIVELALDAMGVKAFLESTGEDMAALRIGGVRPDIPDRALSEVPGLKDWLISRYREQQDEWGGDYSIIFSAAKVPEEGPIDFVAVLAEKPGWVHIPYALARRLAGRRRRAYPASGRCAPVRERDTGIPAESRRVRLGGSRQRALGRAGGRGRAARPLAASSARLGHVRRHRRHTVPARPERDPSDDAACRDQVARRLRQRRAGSPHGAGQDAGGGWGERPLRVPTSARFYELRSMLESVDSSHRRLQAAADRRGAWCSPLLNWRRT